ncbi:MULTISPECIES: baseplate multidomain protein megatron [Hyphobacterium]|uniref:Glycoside hydrolase/phage tail family protein n=1 Tax=Hyphobacterium vulgare TaxID=1736751 RepID=A0ABV6ZUN9_9PROT
MAQLLLGAAGSALGGSILPGSVSLFGSSISGAALGGFVGAQLGAIADRTLLGALGPDREGPRLPDLRLQASTEGAPIPRLYGRARIAGQVIWAARYTETATKDRAGSKGGPSATAYSYTVSFAVGLSEGVIDGVGRVWANGAPLDLSQTDMRIHRGTEDQLPDALIQAVEGAQNAPAFRGLAYAVFEDFPLDDFGARIPNLSFEVFRPSPVADPGQPRLEQMIRGVDLIPASGEFAYAVEPMMRRIGPGKEEPENVHNGRGVTDFAAAIDDLEARLPNCRSVLIVSAWFGDDLRCGACEIRPGVETRDKVTRPLGWQVAGESRTTAWLVTEESGRPVYGGTPDDASLIAAIRELKARGFTVSLYPFILMDIPAGNGLPDPYGGAEQAAFPWRGRITCHPAPGQLGTPDKSAAAGTQVADFFGSAAAADFAMSGDAVSYAGPAEWGFNRFILHHAALAAIAGADGFLIGSEMVGLTTIRDAADHYPAVDALCGLAADARSILGSGVRLSYAADWSEYSGHRPADGSGDVFFHLDPLWSHPAIDAVAIDWYAPIADWRDGDGHADAALSRSGHDLDYLAAGAEGGEGYDWYYASDADRLTQTRTTISDIAHGEDWVFRVKDIRGWWSHAHHNRPGGVRSATPTGWVPQSKPVWLTETGCPAVDKGANQPNVFVDPKSAESSVPYFSAGARDDLIQRRYLEAVIGHWTADDTVSALYSGPMIDPADIHVWTWDARPFPDFPARDDVWGDGANWRLGHWLTGRMGLAPLGDVVRDLAGGAGIGADVSALDGLVSGYLVDRPMAVRDALAPLAELFGFGATDTAGGVRFGRADGPPATLIEAELVVPDRGEVMRCERQDLAGLPSDLRIHFITDGDDYSRGAVLARNRLGAARGVTDLAVPLLADAGQAAGWAQIALRRLEGEGERFAFTLPPSALSIEPGDRVLLHHGGGTLDLTLADLSGGNERQATALPSQETGSAISGATPGRPRGSVRPPSRADLFVLDVPLLGGEAARPGPLAAVAAEPWYGVAAIHAGDGLTRRAVAERPCLSGRLLEPLVPAASGRIVAQSIAIALDRGGLGSVTEAALLAGANRLAVETGEGWEVLQFRDATLAGEGVWQIGTLLRGQCGSETDAPLPAGSTIVILDNAPVACPVWDHEWNTPIEFRGGPVQLTADHASYGIATVTIARTDLRPLSPVHLRAVREDGDLTVRWIRRTRVGGDAWGIGDVPLGEAFERYQIAVGPPGGVSETFLSAVPVWTLDPGEEAALFGGLLDEVEIAVSQVSECYGPGRAATGVFIL